MASAPAPPVLEEGRLLPLDELLSPEDESPPIIIGLPGKGGLLRLEDLDGLPEGPPVLEACALIMRPSRLATSSASVCFKGKISIVKPEAETSNSLISSASKRRLSL